MNVFSKCLLTLTLACVGMTAMANDELKISTAKMAISNENISSYATPTLRRLLDKAHEVNKQKMAMGWEIGCDFAEHFYLGFGQDGYASDGKLSNINVSVLGNGNVKVQQRGLRNETIIKMTCESGACLIDDVIHDGDSLRQDAQRMASTGRCLEELQ